MKTHPRRLAALLLLSACCFAHAAIYAATMASQPWVTNRIAEAEARTDAKITAATNAIPAVGDYATVSNRAMSALQSHQPLTPATNYANQVGASVATSATNYTDAVASDIRQNYIPINGSAITDVELFMNQPLHEQGQLRLELPDGSSVDAKLFVSSSQITNQGAVAAARAMAARKQDALPYPTNAIPYAAISGAPSGGPEWRVEWRSLDAGQYVEFVTNGCIHASFGQSVVLNYSRAGWPDGAAMFVRATGVPQSYWPNCREGDSSLRLVGYGTWPTNNFQSVWWRSGTNIFVNVLLEE